MLTVTGNFRLLGGVHPPPHFRGPCEQSAMEIEILQRIIDYVKDYDLGEIERLDLTKDQLEDTDDDQMVLMASEDLPDEIVELPLVESEEDLPDEIVQMPQV